MHYATDMVQLSDRTALISWVLDGDVSVQYQTRRDLLDDDRPDLRDRIATEGWGARFIAARGPDGHWGRGFYQPKWTSSHYTLLDLRTLEAPQGVPEIDQTIRLILRKEKGDDGGVNPGKTIAQSDVCVNGMMLNVMTFFGAPESDLRSLVDFVLGQRMLDGGFNCRSNRSGARHGSLHTTLSVAEGLHEYRRQGYNYRVEEVLQAEKSAREFMLLHRLFRSDHTGEVIHPSFLMLSFPGRWKYNILRALDYFQDARVARDERMSGAIEVLREKQRSDGTWPLQAKHPGETHFDMEKPGKPSRWNTLRALRVLRTYGTD